MEISRFVKITIFLDCKIYFDTLLCCDVFVRCDVFVWLFAYLKSFLLFSLIKKIHWKIYVNFKLTLQQ